MGESIAVIRVPSFLLLGTAPQSQYQSQDPKPKSQSQLHFLRLSSEACHNEYGLELGVGCGRECEVSYHSLSPHS